MSTPLDAPVNPVGSKKNREQEINRLIDEFDGRTGRKPQSPAEPLHDESKLSKETIEALDAFDALEAKKKSGGFYKETFLQKLQQDAFDQLVKNGVQGQGGKWVTGPITKKERLLAWHKALGTPQHIVDAEIQDLEAHK